MTWALWNCYQKRCSCLIENSIVLNSIEHLLLSGIALVYLTALTLLNPLTLSFVTWSSLNLIGAGCIITVVATLIYTEATKYLDGSVLGTLYILSPATQLAIGV